MTPHVGSTVHELVDAGRRGEVDATRLREFYESRLQRAQQLNALRHRFRITDPAEGLLTGIPYVTKANIAVRGESLDCSSAILEGFRSPYDATVTARLRRAGAVCLGSTNMDEFGMGSSSEWSVQGAVEHPFLRGHVAGGSSGGAASAVAAGLVPFALGSDTGGSIRQPAAYCGLVGLKPTWGRVSRYGLVAFASSFDQIGPITRCARDAAMVLQVIAGRDEGDATTAGDAFDPSGGLPLEGLRVAVLDVEGVDAQTRGELADVARALEDRGAVGTQVTLPSLDLGLAAYAVIAFGEASSNLARFDGSVYGARVEGAAFEDSVRMTRQRGFGPEVKLRLLLGAFVLSEEWAERYMQRAQSLRSRLRREVDFLLRDHDVILMPTTPGGPFRRGALLDDPVAMRQADRYTVLANLTGHPAVAVPSGADASGHPRSVQILGRAFDEATILRVAEAIEELRDIHRLRAERWSSFWWEGA